jgi:glycosyltransferase involved in cell wall biosynthesis
MIAPQPFFEPRGTPFSVLGRLRALSHLGHEVDLVTYHIGKNVTLPGVSITRTPAIPFIRRISIGPSKTKLILDLLLFVKAFFMMLRTRYDLVHTHEEASFFGIFLAKLFRVRHLYDMHSSLPQQLSNFQYTHFRPLIRLFEWMERYVICSSNGVITICSALEKHAREVSAEVPQILIENVAVEGDAEKVPEEILEKFKATYALMGKRVILYAGTFEPYQGIDLLIASAERISRQYQDVVFLLMGGDESQVRQYQEKIDRLGLTSHFRLTGMRPPTEIPQAIRLSHLLVSPRIYGTNTPLKIYSYLHSGKPIVATNLPTHTQVLNHDVALLVDPHPDAFAKGISMILEGPESSREMGQRARRYFDAHYSFDIYLKKTEHILQLAGR